MNARNSNATIEQSLPSSPFAEITTRAPLLSDTKLEPSDQLQQVSSPTDQVAAQSVKQSSVASESSRLRSVHQAPQISLLPQTNQLQASNKSEQTERSVLFTATERILIDETEDQVLSSQGQEVIEPTSGKVLVWMPPGITTSISQETSNNNIKFSDISAITSTLNPIASESFVSQVNKTTAISSSTSLPPPSPATPITTKMPKIEVKVPSDYQSSIPVPVAKPLIPMNSPETTMRYHEFLNDNSQITFPEPDIIQAGFKTLSPMNHNYGISLKKSDQLLLVFKLLI